MKRVTASEKERHWINIPAGKRDCFPPPNVTFKVTVGDKVEFSYVDSYYRLRLGSSIFDELDLDNANTFIILEKGQGSEYILRRNKLPIITAP